MHWPRGQKVKSQGDTVTKTIAVVQLLVTCAATAVCCCCQHGSAYQYDCLCFLVVVYVADCRKTQRYSQQLCIWSHATRWSDEQLCATATASQWVPTVVETSPSLLILLWLQSFHRLLGFCPFLKTTITMPVSVLWWMRKSVVDGCCNWRLWWPQQWFPDGNTH